MARKARISAAVLTVLRDGDRHAWTLDELHQRLTERGFDCDFSSVFRAAGKLVADGVVRKIVLDDGRTRLEPVGAHHDHLYCERCNELVPIPCVIGQRDLVALEHAAGVAITDHHLVLSGICRSCRALLDPGAAGR
jgi:Fur family transcriptional regulator, ferric uptake regulator